MQYRTGHLDLCQSTQRDTHRLGRSSLPPAHESPLVAVRRKREGRRLLHSRGRFAFHQPRRRHLHPVLAPGRTDRGRPVPVGAQHQTVRLRHAQRAARDPAWSRTRSGDILPAVNGGASRTALGCLRFADARLFSERPLSTTRVVFSTTEQVDCWTCHTPATPIHRGIQSYLLCLV